MSEPSCFCSNCLKGSITRRFSRIKVMTLSASPPQVGCVSLPESGKRQRLFNVRRYPSPFVHSLLPGVILRDRKCYWVSVADRERTRSGEPAVLRPTIVARWFSAANPATISVALA
jgi:hypothetical protein